MTQFQPPSSLSPSLLSSVHVTLLRGGAVMAVERATRGHAGFYTCQAVGPSAQELQLSVKLNVETIGAFIPHLLNMNYKLQFVKQYIILLRCLAELLC